MSTPAQHHEHLAIEVDSSRLVVHETEHVAAVELVPAKAMKRILWRLDFLEHAIAEDLRAFASCRGNSRRCEPTLAAAAGCLPRPQ